MPKVIPVRRSGPEMDGGMELTAASDFAPTDVDEFWATITQVQGQGATVLMIHLLFILLGPSAFFLLPRLAISLALLSEPKSSQIWSVEIYLIYFYVWAIKR